MSLDADPDRLSPRWAGLPRGQNYLDLVRRTLHRIADYGAHAEARAFPVEAGSVTAAVQPTRLTRIGPDDQH